MKNIIKNLKRKKEQKPLQTEKEETAVKTKIGMVIEFEVETLKSNIRNKEWWINALKDAYVYMPNLLDGYGEVTIKEVNWVKDND